MNNNEIAKYFIDKVAADGFAVVPMNNDVPEKFGDVSPTTLGRIVRSLVPLGYLIQYFAAPNGVKTRKVLVPAGTTYTSMLKRRDEIFKAE